MNKPSLSEQQLERFIGSILSKQSLRQAPATLEARVLHALAQQAARPWWLQGFSRWPMLARLAFLPLGFGFVKLSFLSTGQLLSLWQLLQNSAPAGTARTGAQTLGNLGQAVQTLGNLLTRDIPSAWLYGGAGLTLLLYAAVFGIGAAAFRVLIVTPEPVRY